METAKDARPEGPPRRGGAELDEAIRDAVRTELGENGYAGLTFEGVARRARTSKPVIYRRYASRAQMVVDAWVRHMPAALPTASTGSLREDLLALGRALGGRFEHIGLPTLRGLMAEVDEDLLPGLLAMADASAHELIGSVVEAARERGEVGPAPLSPRILQLPLVLARHELLFHGHIEEKYLADLIDEVCLPLMTARTPSARA